MAPRKDARLDRIVLGIIFALSALPLLLFRSFPFNDDWAFVFPVEHWMRYGSLRLSQGGSPTLLFQVLWGRLFCVPFGFSFDALRISTLVLAVAGILAFRETLRALGASRGASLAGALLLLFNPLFFLLSQSFMTDVPALSLMLLSGWAFVEGARQERDLWFVVGGVLSGLAYLVRQTGVAPAIAGFVWILVERRRAWRRLAAAALPPLAAIAAHAAWLGASGSPFALRSYFFAATLAHLSHPRIFLDHLLARLGGATLYLGIFLAPLSTIAPLRRRGTLILVAALGALWLILIAAHIPPQTGNTIGRFGLGTCSMGLDCAYKAAGVFGFPWLWILLTFLAPPALGVLFWRLDRPKGISLLYAGGLLLAFAITLPGRDYYDRYYLPLFPAVIALVVGRVEFQWRRFAPLLCAIVAWSVLGTWDCLAWNQARWRGGYQLAAEGIDPKQIENGIDWDAYFNFEDQMTLLLKEGETELAWDSWFKGLDFRAFVSFSARPRSKDWKPLGHADYWSPLSLKIESLHLWTR